MEKSTKGRKTVIQSETNLQRITTRISKEAIEILNEQPNKAAFIDAAIKTVGGKEYTITGKHLELVLGRARGK